MSQDLHRPNADELLARIQVEESQRTRGRLKIFLGYAAGVGKTYAMLDAARQRRAEGVDVVIAYVETHGRAETEQLAAGFETIPRQRVEYRGIALTEMDADAILARHPQIAVIDELAHTNAPGSRHPKRYLDVEDVLAAGIDVYTTFNIQHLESLRDVVAQITGVTIQETVPDHVFDSANEIELVDIPTGDLRRRLDEGKVYVPDQAARAVSQFFRPGNLAALRELALRRAAERVDAQMRSYMQERSILGPWPAGERLLVCVSPSALSERLVRAGRRLAAGLGAQWIALYVETDSARLSQAEHDQVSRALQLAEELGAKTATLPSDDVAETIIQYARRENITKIIAGKPLRPRWTELFRTYTTDEIIRRSGDIDVYVISGTGEAAPAENEVAVQPGAPLRHYAYSAALVAAVAIICYVLFPVVDPVNVVMLFLIPVVVAAVRWGRGPAILASMLGVLTFDFFFVPPSMTFAVSDAQYIVTFLVLLIVGLVISTLAVRERDLATAAQRRTLQTAALYSLSGDLAAAGDLDSILAAATTHISQTVSREVAILLPSDGALALSASTAGLILSEDELAVASWAFQHGQPAGRGTNTLPGAAGRYLPLKSARGVVGVLSIKPAAASARLTAEQQRLLEAFASQTAQAIERVQLAEEARQAELHKATEKLQTALLNSVSHDLRTPLASITGALTSLLDNEVHLDEPTRRGLIESAHQEAQRLNRVVGDLLDMTRLEAGAMKLSHDPCDVQDVIGAALAQMGDRLRDRRVVVAVPDDLPLVPMDFVLMTQVLVNLLDNAIKYSQPETTIDVRACLVEGSARIEVWDRGSGIAADELAHVFDRFYGVQHPGRVSGTGMGLSIAKGIVDLHCGRLTAANRPGGGAVFSVELPLQAPPDQ